MMEQPGQDEDETPSDRFMGSVKQTNKVARRKSSRQLKTWKHLRPLRCKLNEGTSDGVEAKDVIHGGHNDLSDKADSDEDSGTSHDGHSDMVSDASNEPEQVLTKKQKKSAAPRNGHKKEQITCPYCNELTKSRVSYHTHVYRVHNVVVDGAQIFTCKICEKIFMSKQYLDTHVTSFHKDRNPLTCPFCGKIKRGSHLMVDHIKTVHEAPRFMCHLCGQTCVTNSRLRGHIKEKHERNRPYTCNVQGCTSAFFRQKSLSIHMRNVHEKAKDFKCSWAKCDKAFHSGYSLKRHELVHSGAKPIKCKYCEYSCRQNTSLKWHMRRSHSECEEVIYEDIISDLGDDSTDATKHAKTSQINTDLATPKTNNSAALLHVFRKCDSVVDRDTSMENTEDIRQRTIATHKHPLNQSNNYLNNVIHPKTNSALPADSSLPEYRPPGVMLIPSNCMMGNDNDVAGNEDTSLVDSIEHQVVHSLQHVFVPGPACSRIQICHQTPLIPILSTYDSTQSSSLGECSSDRSFMYNVSQSPAQWDPTTNNHLTVVDPIQQNVWPHEKASDVEDDSADMMDNDDLIQEIQPCNDVKSERTESGLSDIHLQLSGKSEHLSHFSQSVLSPHSVTYVAPDLNKGTLLDMSPDRVNGSVPCDQANQYSFLCQWCGEVMCSMTDYSAHLMERHDISSSLGMITNTIAKCPTKRSRRAYVDPIILDETEKHSQLTFLCPTCGLRLKCRSALQRHLLNEHDDLPPNVTRYTCPLCDKEFFGKFAFDQHNKVVHSERIPCKVCGKMLKPSYLAEHEKNVHSEGGNRFKCEICHQGCVSRSRLKFHIMEKHENAKRFSCPIRGCLTSFLRMTTYRAHMDQVHNKMKEYKCTWTGCSKAFGRQNHLVRHLLLHTGEKPIKCSMCSYSCRQNGSLKLHMQNIHHVETS